MACVWGYLVSWKLVRAYRGYGAEGKVFQIYYQHMLWPWPWRYDTGSCGRHTFKSCLTIVQSILKFNQSIQKLWRGRESVPNLLSTNAVTLTLEIWLRVMCVTHLHVMLDNISKYLEIWSKHLEVMEQKGKFNKFAINVCCDLDLGDMTPGHVHDTPSCHACHLC